MLGCFCQFCAQPQATTIEENLSVSCTEVAISDNSLPCQQSDSEVEESEPAVSVTTTAGENWRKDSCKKETVDCGKQAT